MKNNERIEKNFFLKEIYKKKEECQSLIEEISALKDLLVEDNKELNELIEEIELDPNILNIPKFKGQTVFEKYLEIIENKKNKKKKIKNKRKTIGLIQKNEIIKARKDINKIKEMLEQNKKE